MKKVLAAAGMAFLAALACAQTEPTVQQISSRLTANDLKADVSFLASDALQGRGTPSPGLEVAAEYIAAQFRRAGLEPAGDDGYFQTALYGTTTPNLEGMEFTVEAGGHTVQAHKESMTMQQAGAADFSRAPLIKVMGSDAPAINALTPEQVRGKILVLDFPDGANAQAITRQLPVMTARLQPGLVVILRSGGQPPAGNGRLREMSSAPSIPVLVVWDDAIRTALVSGKPAPSDAAVTVHIPPPTVVP